VGVYLPRNADEQEASAGLHVDLSKLDDAGKLAAIKELPIGSCLYMDGHCMLYIGKSNDIPYVLHALGSYYKDGKSVNTMRVVVSDLTLQRHNGKTLLSDLTTAVVYK
jgi:hypothetical protein